MSENEELSQQQVLITDNYDTYRDTFIIADQHQQPNIIAQPSFVQVQSTSNASINCQEMKTIIYQCGAQYYGQIQHNQRHGQGRQQYPNSNYYDGNWRNDTQDGYGVFKYHTGDVYEGYFQKGLFSGFGKYFYSSSGKQYQGYWLNNRWNGQGKLFDSHANVLIDGVWENDILIKENAILIKERRESEGQKKQKKTNISSYLKNFYQSQNAMNNKIQLNDFDQNYLDYSIQKKKSIFNIIQDLFKPKKNLNKSLIASSQQI